jgi:hypothetical protein
MSSEQINCIDCRFYANVKPYLDDAGRQVGQWSDGDCTAANTLHPRTYSWNSCWLAKQKRAQREGLRG